MMIIDDLITITINDWFEFASIAIINLKTTQKKLNIDFCNWEENFV